MTKSIVLYLDVISPFAYMAFWLTRNSPAFTSPSTPVKITYIPILLGGLMQQTGNTPPINIKNKDKWIGLERQRWAQKLKIPISTSMPEPFPQPTVNTQRALCFVQKEMSEKDLIKAFEALYYAFWVENKTIGKVEVIEKALGTVFEKDKVAKILEGMKGDGAKKALRENGEAAFRDGAFGLPWFVATNDKGVKEGFWGVDHVGQLMEHLGLELKGEDGRYRSML